MFITSKAQIRDLYAALLSLNNALKDDLLTTTTYTRPAIEFSGTPPVKGKPSKFDRSTGSHKLFILPEMSFASAEVCGK